MKRNIIVLAAHRQIIEIFYNKYILKYTLNLV